MRRKTIRKIKKVFNYKTLFTFLLIIIPAFLFIMTGYGLFSTRQNINGTAKIKNNTGKDEEDINDICHIEINWDIASSWSNNYIVDITLTNHSNDDIHTWVIKFPNVPNVEITSQHGTVTESNNHKYIHALDWNGKILLEESLTFQAQFTTSEDITNILNNIVITNCGRVTTNEDDEIGSGNAKLELLYGEVELDASLTLIAGGDWGGQVNRYTLTITNNTEFDIVEWRGIVYFGNKSTNPSQCTIYEATLTDKADTHFYFEDNGGNNTIKAGESLEMNLVIYTNDAKYFPQVTVAGLKAD